MNRSAAIAVSLLLTGAAALAWAQDATPASGTVPAVKPGMRAGKHPRIREIRARLKEQIRRIREGVRSKKITKDEAKDLRAKVLAVRDQMKADIQQNGKMELTEEQTGQLNQMLDENSKDIYGEKNGGTAPPEAGAAPGGEGSPAAP